MEEAAAGRSQRTIHHRQENQGQEGGPSQGGYVDPADLQAPDVAEVAQKKSQLL